MITNKEKIEIVINKINNIDALVMSLINNYEICKDKYVLEDELLICSTIKTVLEQEMLALTNQD